MSDQEQQSTLSPPDRRGTADPGARELAEASDSEEHYSDAQSGPMSPARASPIPRTRVERVDDRPAYGEVPGTPAYRLREGDAEPDEIAIVPDPTDPTPPEAQQVSRPPTPGGHPIPKTVVEETPDAEGAVSRPESRQRRKSDAHPDLVVKADGQRVDGGEAANDAPIPESLSTPSTPTTRTRRKSSPTPEEPPSSHGLPEPESAISDAEDDGQNEDGGEDDFDNDFDDFEEGGEDGDFGDFDDDFQAAEAPPAAAPPPQPPAAQTAPSLPFPIPNYESLSPSDILTLTSRYLSALYPPPTTTSTPLPLPPPTKENPFLTPRSASLWAQLVAPPPLQPPDWIRSRIRRLFLVSLGVPVDLDEILPASSKQKKLVLPSVRLRRASSSGSLGTDRSRRVSSDSRGGVAARSSAGTAGLEGGGEGGGRRSTGSRAGGGGKTGRRAGGGGGGNGGGSGDAAAAARASDPERRFDLVSARQACTLTDAALNGMTDAELRAHLERLQAMQGTAQAVLTYWQKRTDEKIGDREAFEGVIENLVKHARKVRK